MQEHRAANYHPGFCHRPEDLGNIGSICLKCFATVARTKLEKDLAQFERDHVCDPYDLERFKNVKSRSNASN
jgi:hypothetical protein